MINSRQLAQLVGPTLSIMTLAEMINLSIWESTIPSVVFLNGTLFFVAGISIVRVHNFWINTWTILLTLIGWLTLSLGLLRMFFPSVNRIGESISTYSLLAVLFLVGLFLSWKGYNHNKDSNDKSVKEIQ
jgi:hypothetical protein